MKYKFGTIAILLSIVLFCALTAACQPCGSDEGRSATNVAGEQQADTSADAAPNAAQGDIRESGETGASNDESISNVAEVVVLPDGTPVFQGFERPLAEMPLNDDGTINADDGRRIIRNRLQVCFVTGGGFTDETMREILESCGFVVDYTYYSTLFDEGDAYVYVPDGMSMEDAVLLLSDVEGVETVYLKTKLEHEPHGWRMWDLERGDEEESPEDVVPPIDLGEYHLAWSRFDAAFDVSRCDGKVVVAVLDTGAPAQTISDLAPNVDYSRMHDATGGDCYDTQGHGTAVASIVSAVADNEEGCTGCSWNASILPVRVCQGAEFEEDGDGKYIVQPILDGLDYLIGLNDPPDVVNMSFGGSAEEVSDDEFVDKLQSRIDALSSKGCVCVAAVGNDGVFDIRTIAQQDHDNSVNYPAACDNVLAVGSIDKPLLKQPTSLGDDWAALSLSGFSNTASGTDICAFGDTVETVCEAVIPLMGYGIRKETGTSFAAPQVAAAAALIKAKHPGWGYVNVRSVLTCTAHKTSAMNGASYVAGYGYGLLDASAAVSWSPSSGGGTSPFTGPGGDYSLNELQVAAQQRIQATQPDDIPDALGRAMKANPDVFAWLYVPGTDVSVPVARREGDGSYYLHHDSFGNESSIGCAYTQQGAGDLSDAVTVLYGHSFSSGSLAFTELHKFEDRAFFAGHEKVYLYLPGRRLEYRVVGANLFNARAIEEVDQTDPDDLGDYFAELSNPDPDAFMGSSGASRSMRGVTACCSSPPARCPPTRRTGSS